MDPRRALMLQVEWGADEALDSIAQTRLRAPSVTPSVPPSIPAMTSPAAPAAEPVAFDGGGLAATATHRILPVGRVSANSGGLMVIGVAPGDAEDRSGEAFVGPEGQLLRRMLASIGLDPAEVLLSYLVPWRPPGGRAPTDAEVNACLPSLHGLVADSGPTLLLALGNVPAKALLGPAMRRGRWAKAAIRTVSAPIETLPMANPAVVLKHPAQKAQAWAELRMLRRRITELTTISRQITV